MDLIGYDWGGVINIFVGTLLLISGKPKVRSAGFFSMALGNVFFLLYGQEVGSQAIMLSSLVFFPLNILGIVLNIWYVRTGK